jgi:hypothetical protein
VKRSFAILFLVPLLLLSIGCSGKLSRREAKHQIDAMLKPHPVGLKKVMSPGGVPGFQIDNWNAESTALPFFTLDVHKEYDVVDSAVCQSLCCGHGEPISPIVPKKSNRTEW